MLVKKIIFLLLISIYVVPSYAQTSLNRPVREPATTTGSARDAKNTKDLKAIQATGITQTNVINGRNIVPQTQFLNIPKADDTHKVWYAKTYTVNFLGNNLNAADAICTIQLFDANQKNVGNLSFYTSTAKQLNDLPSIVKNENNELLEINYNADKLQTMLTFLNNTKGLVIYYDTKTKKATLSSGLQNIK